MARDARGTRSITPLTLPPTFSLAKHGEWWAEDLSTTSALATWQDRTGNGRDFTQGTAARRPAVDVGHATGRKRVTFTAASTHFMQTAAWASLAQPNTLLIVGSRASTPGAAAGYAFLDGITSTDRHRFDYYNTTPDQWRAGAASMNLTVASYKVAATATFSAVMTMNGATSGLYVDEDQSDTVGDVSTHALTGLTIGAQYDGATWPLDGSILYVCALDGTATAGDRTAFFEWVRGFYGSGYMT